MFFFSDTFSIIWICCDQKEKGSMVWGTKFLMFNIALSVVK